MKNNIILILLVIAMFSIALITSLLLDLGFIQKYVIRQYLIYLLMIIELFFFVIIIISFLKKIS